MTLWKDRDVWAISIRGSAFALQAKVCDFEHHIGPPNMVRWYKGYYF